MRKFINYLKESTVELTKKTTWPSWEKLMNSALLVMVTTALLAVAIWVIDYAFQLVMTAIYSL
ncbi:MAG: preprotein translocase subunit SecE [Rikenellaceae bacterium]|nr:preprotein translocase subunit SecE [Rikenellaceae bacterium]MDD5951394.1 preprotein translocase subunit SecE [Bacteroidales bacterium]